MLLMEALRGAAVDTAEPRKVITAESLRNFLYNQFETYMVPSDRTKSGVPREPHVDYEERGLKLVIGPAPPRSFAEKILGATPPKYPVRLVATSPSAAGAAFTILRKSKKVAEGKIDGSTIELEAGLHVLEVPGANYHDVIEVKATKDLQDVSV